MLALTHSAAEVIHDLLQQPGVPDSAGLRIARTPADGTGDSLGIALVSGPADGDEVHDEQGARVFVEETTVPLLDDKLLDATQIEGQTTFTLAIQAPE